MSAADDVAETLVSGLRAQLPPAGFRLDGIEVHLGEEVDLTATELRDALERALPGVTIEITPIGSALKCLDCGAEYPSDEHPCPVCGSPNAAMIHGNELTIARAWGESDAAPG